MPAFNYDRINVVLTFEAGLDEKGKSIWKNVTLTNVRPTLTADEIVQVALGLASLVKPKLIYVKRIVTEFVDA